MAIDFTFPPEIDDIRRRVSEFVEQHPVGSTIEGEVKNATEFGLFIGLEGDIDGMVHLSDIDWNTPGEEAMSRYKKGDMVKAKVLDVDVEKERISLGIKQLAGDPMVGDSHRKGQTVTTTVTEITTGGIEVKFGDDAAPMTAFIRKSDLSRDRSEQRPDRFAVGQIDHHFALADDRRFVLTDLITLRDIRVKIIFSRKIIITYNFAIESKAKAYSIINCFFIHYR